MSATAIIMGCSVGIIAILSGNYYKLERAKLRSGGMSKEDKQLLLAMKEENEKLKERLQNIEYIVTNIDENLLPPGSLDRPEDAQIKLAEMTKRLKQ